MLATILGFIVGIARLSKNWLVARLAAGYVEIIRNLPLLLQLLFWYNAVLKALPDIRDSLRFIGRQLPQQSRLVPAAADFRAGLAGCVGIALLIGVGRRVRHLRPLGAASGRWRPASRRRSFWCALGAADRLAAAGRSR